MIYYKWSKTNQHASKVSWIPIHSVSNSRFNVRTHLKNLFDLVNVANDAPLFSFIKGCHSKFSLIRLLDKCVYDAGLPLRDYSWHSFRRGAAVFAFELGLADSAVQLLGDWSSPAFKQYLEFSFIRKASVAKKTKKKIDIVVNNL